MVGAGILLVLLAIGILVGAYLFLQVKVPTEPTTSSPINPFSSLVSTTTTSGGVTTLELVDGTHVTIPDFSKTEQPEGASEENGYQVSGDAESSFQILYFPRDSGFIVALNAEPLGETRLAAERALREALRLSDNELCKMRADVGTDYSVSRTYAGKNLGLSFCPGAVVLP